MTEVTVSNEQTCAIQDGAVKCWGLNLHGQLGHSMNLGTLMPNPTPTVVEGMSSGASLISTGHGHTCALKGESLHCWGRNHRGQLGSEVNLGTETLEPSPAAVVGLKQGPLGVSAGLVHTCAILAGALYCWGEDTQGQLGINANPTADPVSAPTAVLNMSSGVTKVAAGINHTCAIRSGDLFCWGLNYAGQLGEPTFNDPRATPKRVAFP